MEKAINEVKAEILTKMRYYFQIHGFDDSRYSSFRREVFKKMHPGVDIEMSKKARKTFHQFSTMDAFACCMGRTNEFHVHELIDLLCNIVVNYAKMR
jgi:hypothetical protein